MILATNFYNIERSFDFLYLIMIINNSFDSYQDFFVSEHQNIVITSRLPKAYSINSEFSKITLIKKGIGLHVVNGKPYPIYPGMLFFTQSTDLHIYEHTENLEAISILYLPSSYFVLIKGFEALIPKQFASFHIHRFLDKNSVNTIEMSLNKLIASAKKTYIEQESLFLRFLVNLRHCSYHYNQENSSERRFLRLIRWLLYNFDENINWNALSEQFSVPIRTLHRYLDKDINLSPQRFVTKLRLFNAYYQLLYTNESVISVAMANGFEDQSYFATCFKKEFGVSPRTIQMSGGKRI